MSCKLSVTFLYECQIEIPEDFTEISQMVSLVSEKMSLQSSEIAISFKTKVTREFVFPETWLKVTSFFKPNHQHKIVVSCHQKDF